MILNLKFLKEFILVAYKVYDIGTVRLFTTRIQRSYTILILIFNKKKKFEKNYRLVHIGKCSGNRRDRDYRIGKHECSRYLQISANDLEQKSQI